MQNSEKSIVQSKVFEFAFSELVRNQRNAFQPLWTLDSWVKFLIWMALNCGFSGEKESISLFIEALDSYILNRMRKLFFERILEEYSIHLMADPAEKKVYLFPADAQVTITLSQVEEALKDVGLIEKVLSDSNVWECNDGIFSIPWKTK